MSTLVMDLIEWFNARDALHESADVLFEETDLFRVAFRRLLDCAHINSQWLRETFAAGVPQNPEEAEDTLLAIASPQAISLASLLSSDWDLLLQAVELEDGFACARYSRVSCISHDTALLYATTAADKGDREGMYQMAKLAQKEKIRRGMPADYGEYQAPAMLGHASSCYMYAHSFHDVRMRFVWFEKALSCYNKIDEAVPFIYDEQGLSEQEAIFHAAICALKDFEEGKCSASIMYQIGRICSEQFRTEMLAYRHEHSGFKRILEIYRLICEYYRKAAITWLLIAKTLPAINKDIRGIIARMVWSYRHEAEYDLSACPNDHYSDAKKLKIK